MTGRALLTCLTLGFALAGCEVEVRETPAGRELGEDLRDAGEQVEEDLREAGEAIDRNVDVDIGPDAGDDP